MINKLIKKYKNMPVQVRASFWFLICAFLQKGISFITTPIFTRLLTTAEYGQYNVFNSWMSIIMILVTLNLSAGVFTSGLVKFEKEKNVYTSSFLGLTLFLMGIWFIIYIIFHDFWNNLFGLTTTQMFLMFQMIWTTSIFTFWSIDQRVEFKYRKLVIITIIVSIVKPVLGIILVSILDDKVTARILGIAIVELIAYGWLFFVLAGKGKKFYSAKYWKYAFLFNVPLIPHYLSMSVLNNVDRIMIKDMVSESAAGIYSLAYSISMIMMMFNTALMQTVEPWLYKKIKENNIKEISKVAYPSFGLVAILNILLIAFAPEIIRFFAPIEYYESIYVIPPVAMSVYFIFSYTFFAVFEFYYAQTKQIAIATSIGAIINLGLNYIFIKLFGYIAAAYTTLLCYIIFSVVHYYFMCKICREKYNGEMPYNNKVFLIMTFGFVLFGFAILFTYNYPIIRYGSIIVICIIGLIKKKQIIRTVKELLALKKQSI